VEKEKAKSSRPGRLELRVQEMARREAKRQAQQIPWERLLQARTEYIEWEIFGFWVRSIVEAEDAIPDWLQIVLETRCPGFLESERHYREANPGKAYFFPSRLSEWIDEHIFAEAHKHGWMLAITFYAVRDFRYHRAWAYWEHCEEMWKRRSPEAYPSFEEWRRAAENWDAEPPRSAYSRKAYEAYKRVSAERLAEAVTSFMNWEAFAYWTRSALEERKELPNVVAEELRRRCPGFLEYDEQLRKTDPPGERQRFMRLMAWGENQLFGEAKKEGWFDAITFYARRHPRDVRTAEYWGHWADRLWDPTQGSYPSFEEWRQAADNYVVDPSEDDE